MPFKIVVVVVVDIIIHSSLGLSSCSGSGSSRNDCNNPGNEHATTARLDACLSSSPGSENAKAAWA